MPDLSPGDRVTVAATHQVKIDGLDSWIKAEVNAAVLEGESSTEAFDRIGEIVAARTVAEINRQAAPVVEANAAQR